MNIKNLHSIERLKLSKAKIAILIASHNSIKTIFNTLRSIYNQKNCGDYIVLISDDYSSDNLNVKLYEILKNYRIIYFRVCFKSVYKNRNYLLNLIYRYGHNVEIIVRCDTDDIFYDDFVLSKIEKSFFTSSTIRKQCNFLLSGNTLYRNGSNTNKVNLATNLLKDNTYLLNRLYLMSKNYSEYELPSCNFVFKKEYNLFYPNIQSAEDHFMLVDSLIKYKNSDFRIDEDFISINYSLSGRLTKKNKKTEYLKRREDLYSFAYKKICYG